MYGVCVCVCLCVSLKYSNVGELKQRITLDFSDLLSRREGDTFKHLLNPCTVNELKGTDDCNKKQQHDISSYCSVVCELPTSDHIKCRTHLITPVFCLKLPYPGATFEPVRDTFELSLFSKEKLLVTP